MCVSGVSELIEGVWIPCVSGVSELIEGVWIPCVSGVSELIEGVWIPCVSGVSEYILLELIEGVWIPCVSGVSGYIVSELIEEVWIPRRTVVSYSVWFCLCIVVFFYSMKYFCFASFVFSSIIINIQSIHLRHIVTTLNVRKLFMYLPMIGRFVS